MASPTADFLKLRSTAKEIKLNQWHNNFSAVKKFAESKNVPLVAVWSNGDACGHCTAFEKALMHSTFKNYQKTSQCAFWFGCSSDKNNEDKFEGVGFKWCYNNGKVTTYPFVRLYWKSGKVDKTMTGDTLRGGFGNNTAKSATNIVNNLKKYFKDYKPGENNCDNCTPPTPAPVFTPPKLTYIKNPNGKCELRVNGESALDVNEEDAKYIVDKYNK